MGEDNFLTLKGQSLNNIQTELSLTAVMPLKDFHKMSLYPLQRFLCALLVLRLRVRVRQNEQLPYSREARVQRHQEPVRWEAGRLHPQVTIG